jgi:hypothetical protein
VGTSTTAKPVTLTNNSSTALKLTYAASADYTVTAGGTTPCTTSLGGKAKCTLNGDLYAPPERQHQWGGYGDVQRQL